MEIPGNTPLIPFSLLKVGHNRIFVKDESQNPTGSIKDRAVYQMLYEAKELGKLANHPTIIEATSGNTGISLGYYQKAFDYEAWIVMPKSASPARKKLIESYGAKLVLVDGGMKECKEEVARLLQIVPNSFELDQFNNQGNLRAHYLYTAREILRDCAAVTHIFAGIGTGGTLMGLAHYFSRYQVSLIGVEPAESPLLTEEWAGPHSIEGIGANFVPPFYEPEKITDVIDVPEEEAWKMARLLREGGFDNGVSSGAALYGCIRYLRKKRIQHAGAVVIFPDKGDRYSW